MGLDITACSQITFVRTLDSNGDWKIGEHQLIMNPSFPGQADRIVDGIYKMSGKTHKFRAGSYSGYSDFRRTLCYSALGINPERVWQSALDEKNEYEGKPFVELIKFSDCEGFIGPETSLKLFGDFKNHEEKFLTTGNDWHKESYKDWLHAFELASNSGVVLFH